jgi:uncharacterized membrane protein
MRKRIFTPAGLVLAVLGFFNIMPQLFDLVQQDANIQIIASMSWGMIALVLGLYMLSFAYKVPERVDNSFRNTAKAIRNGSQMIPFAILSVLLFLAGIFFALDALTDDSEATSLAQFLKVSSILLWMWVFSLFSYQTGKFVNHYLSFGKVYSTSLIVSTSLFAIAFILQASFDMVSLIFGYSNYGEYIIFLMVVVGFLLAGFSGLINMNMRIYSRKADEGPEKESEPLNYPEA